MLDLGLSGRKFLFCIARSPIVVSELFGGTKGASGLLGSNQEAAKIFQLMPILVTRE
jgi:hypothetical protein